MLELDDGDGYDMIYPKDLRLEGWQEFAGLIMPFWKRYEFEPVRDHEEESESSKHIAARSLETSLDRIGAFINTKTMDGNALPFKPKYQHQKPPLSVIMERSSEENTRAGSSSRASSSSSTGMPENDLSVNSDKQHRCKTQTPPTRLSSSKMRQQPIVKDEIGSFVSLSESQARELFDNDVKDRIEFLTSQLEDKSGADSGNNVLGTSSRVANVSYGAYFMRRSSHPMKGGISDESTYLNSKWDCSMQSLQPDFESSRSCSASTPLPNKSVYNQSCRSKESLRAGYNNSDAIEVEDSITESPKNMANASILSLVDYFKGSQSDGKRRDSMIDFVLDYCNKQVKDSQRQLKPATPTCSGIKQNNSNSTFDKENDMSPALISSHVSTTTTNTTSTSNQTINYGYQCRPQPPPPPPPVGYGPPVVIQVYYPTMHSQPPGPYQAYPPNCPNPSQYSYQIPHATPNTTIVVPPPPMYAPQPNYFQAQHTNMEAVTRDETKAITQNRDYSEK